MSLTSQTFSSLRWMSIGRIFSQIVTWSITFLVIRLLDPEDYGLMAASMTVVGFGELFKDLGVGSSLIHSKSFEIVKLRKIFGFILLLSLALTGCFQLIAIPAGVFFKIDGIDVLIQILSLQFFFGAFSILPIVKLNREMQFKRLAIVEIVSNVFSGVLAYVLAIFNYGVFSLVYGHLFGVLIRTVGSIVASRLLIRPIFKIGDISDHLRFGGLVTLNTAIWKFYSQSDIFLAGRILGAEILGFYSIAQQLATLPIQKMSGIINLVGFASLSKIQDNREMFKNHFFQAIEIIAFVSFPVSFGIASIAPELVNIFLGDGWNQAVMPLSMLCLVVPLRMITNATSPALMALGRPGIITKNLLIAFLVMSPSFYIGSLWGLRGLSFAWVFGFPLYFLISTHNAMVAIGIKFSKFLSILFFPFVTSLGMYISITLLRSRLAGGSLHDVISLFFFILVGFFIVTITNFLFRREFCLKCLKLVRG